jgi:NAD(P)-dependent dehydrogenase (short-subunit alcohol dehydrogenase family)
MLQALKSDVKGFSGSLYPLKADVSKEEEVKAAFAWVKSNLGGVDVLINNAGITGKSTLQGTAVLFLDFRFRVSLSHCVRQDGASLLIRYLRGARNKFYTQHKLHFEEIFLIK